MGYFKGKSRHQCSSLNQCNFITTWSLFVKFWQHKARLSLFLLHFSLSVNLEQLWHFEIVLEQSSWHVTNRSLIIKGYLYDGTLKPCISMMRGRIDLRFVLKWRSEVVLSFPNFLEASGNSPELWDKVNYPLSLIHIWRCRRYAVCRSRWSPYH